MKYKVEIEDVLNARILDTEENRIVTLCNTKRPDLAFEKLLDLVDKANQVEEMEIKLSNIWKEINNTVYLDDMKKRNILNLIHEIVEIIKPDYDTLGKEFID